MRAPFKCSSFENAPHRPVLVKSTVNHKSRKCKLVTVKIFNVHSKEPIFYSQFELVQVHCTLKHLTHKRLSVFSSLETRLSKNPLLYFSIYSTSTLQGSHNSSSISSCTGIFLFCSLRYVVILISPCKALALVSPSRQWNTHRSATCHDNSYYF